MRELSLNELFGRLTGFCTMPVRWLGCGLALGFMLQGCQTHAPTVLDLGGGVPAIRNALVTGATTSEALVLRYLERIEQLDQTGPELRSVLSINPNALADARERDAQRAEGRSRGPLHGLPVLLKDNIESQDPLPTTAGSTALLANFAPKDAPLVAQLRAAGAVIMGKTNLSQWANFRSFQSSSGWSAVGGQTKNPHALDRNPCGSSSGSGAAIAAQLAAAAIGTETNGSIICPSNASGIVGFKPTVGLVSQQGIVPIAAAQDTAGPMTLTVAGAALVFDAICPTCDPVAPTLGDASLAGVRLGVLRFAASEQPDVVSAFERALGSLQKAGATLVEISEAPPFPEEFRDHGLRVLLHEFKSSIDAYLAATPSAVPVKSLAELIAFNEGSTRELALFDQSIFETAQATSGVEDAQYIKSLALIQQATRADGIDRLLDEYDVRLLIVPTGPPAPPRDPINGDLWPDGAGFGWAAAVAGYPHATVPMGHSRGMPFGLSFIGARLEDAQVMRAAAVFEREGGERLQPTYRPSAGEDDGLATALDRMEDAK